MIGRVRDGGSLLALAGVLDRLADVFSGPACDARGRAAAWLRDPAAATPPLGALAGPLRGMADASGELGVEYARLFLHGPGATAHPYESFYRTGRLMDPDCLNGLDALFAAAGVRPRDEGSTSPDHLGVELAFLALLLRGLSGSTGDSEVARTLRLIARRLLDEHLLFFSGAFCARLHSLKPAPYFSAAAGGLGIALAAADTVMAVYGREPETR